MSNMSAPATRSTDIQMHVCALACAQECTRTRHVCLQAEAFGREKEEEVIQMHTRLQWFSDQVLPLLPPPLPAFAGL